MEMLGEAGVTLEEYSRASHPSEMQSLVKEGHGCALIREGTVLDDGLVVRPLAGVDWTVDTAVIYHKQRYPKTVPIVVRQLKRDLEKRAPQTAPIPFAQPRDPGRGYPSVAAQEVTVQLSLYGDPQ